MTDRLHDQATAAIPLLTDELLTEVLPELNLYADAVEVGAVTAFGAAQEDENEYIGLVREQLDEVLMTAFTMGLLVGQAGEPESDIVVGIAPEDAARITAGLFANGATITLSVVRDRDQ